MAKPSESCFTHLIFNGSHFRDLFKVASIEDKMRETMLKWFSHVKRRSVDAPVRRCERINIPEGKRWSGQSRKSMDEVIREDLKVIGLTDDMA